MPNVIEVAKSGRAQCRACKKPIAKDDLRLGVEVANQFGGEEGSAQSYLWHHLPCAATKHPDLLRAALADYDGEVSGRDELERLMAEADAKKPPPFPYADRAPTGRARCHACGEPIVKDSLRVAFERDIERGMTVTKGAGYVHPACAAGFWESKGGTHADLTEQLRAHSKLPEGDMDRVLAEV
jgi:poly [ADP-ribose] polymerase